MSIIRKAKEATQRVRSNQYIQFRHKDSLRWFSLQHIITNFMQQQANRLIEQTLNEDGIITIWDLINFPHEDVAKLGCIHTASSIIRLTKGAMAYYNLRHQKILRQLPIRYELWHVKEPRWGHEVWGSGQAWPSKSDSRCIGKIFSSINPWDNLLLSWEFIGSGKSLKHNDMIVSWVEWSWNPHRFRSLKEMATAVRTCLNPDVLGN